MVILGHVIELKNGSGGQRGEGKRLDLLPFILHCYGVAYFLSSKIKKLCLSAI